MKKFFLFFLLALGMMHGRAQLLADADYNPASGNIDVTVRNMSDSLTYIFFQFTASYPEIRYVEMEDGSLLHSFDCHNTLFPGDIYFLHPGEQFVREDLLPRDSRVRAFLLEIPYKKANMPKEEWGKPVDYKIMNWRKYTLPGWNQVDLLRIIK
ncbi:hypothetical protein [Xylanibacter brevis]|uniref:hypothetical protein n=1 Tax=Xylanibacter brevis TaxID=83231 RepID=UPI000480F7C4|nr:hypothetical protein [Xylanibacter brevis]